MAELIKDEIVEEYLQIMRDDSKWKMKKNHGNFTVASRKFPDLKKKLKAYRFVTECECSMEKMVELLHDKMVERHGEWNKTYSGGRIVETIDADRNVQYWKFKPAGLTERDFVVARRRITKPDGTVILVDISVEREDVPPVKDIIRCDLPFNIRVLEPLPDNKIRFSYMNLTDSGGWIPAWLINALNPSVSIEEMEIVIKLCK